MKNLWKYSGTILAITGAIHCVVGLVAGWQGHEAILRGGVVNAVGADLERIWPFGSLYAAWSSFSSE